MRVKSNNISDEIEIWKEKANSSHEAIIEMREKVSPFIYDSNRIRFFDKSFSEIELNKIPYDEFTGDFKITGIETDMVRISPILLENNSINKVRKINESNAINALPKTPNATFTIANINEVKGENYEYETLLNHNKFINFTIFKDENDNFRLRELSSYIYINDGRTEIRNGLYEKYYDNSFDIDLFRGFLSRPLHGL